MKLRKMLKLLKEATENNAPYYTPAELDYMKHQLEVIGGELERLEHRDYKGFGKRHEKPS